MTDSSNFRDAIAELLREAFEGKKPESEGTWFVEGAEAILPTIESLTATQASQIGPGWGASIGAHTKHLAYILNWANACHGDLPPTGTWNETWIQNAFSESEWDSICSEVETRYRAYLHWFSTNTDWSHEAGVIAPIAVLPHVSFHLGAIRRLVMLVAE